MRDLAYERRPAATGELIYPSCPCVREEYFQLNLEFQVLKAYSAAGGIKQNLWSVIRSFQGLFYPGPKFTQAKNAIFLPF